MTRLNRVSQPSRGTERAAHEPPTPGLPIPGRRVHSRRGVTGGGSATHPPVSSELTGRVAHQQSNTTTSLTHNVARAVAQLISSLQVWSFLAQPTGPATPPTTGPDLLGGDVGLLNLNAEQLLVVDSAAIEHLALTELDGTQPSNAPALWLSAQISLIDDRIVSVPAVPLGGRGPTGELVPDLDRGQRGSGHHSRAATTGSIVRNVWLAVVAVVGIPGMILMIAWLSGS